MLIISRYFIFCFIFWRSMQNKRMKVKCQRKARGRYFRFRDDICIFLYHRTCEINAHTSNPLRSEWGIKYPSQARKACDIIFVVDRQLKALSLCQLHRGIVFRLFFIGPRIFQRVPIAQKIEGSYFFLFAQSHSTLGLSRTKVTYLLASVIFVWQSCILRDLCLIMKREK